MVQAASRATPAVAAVLTLLLGSCSGTPFGDQLARSFSAPAQEPNAQAPQAAPSQPAATAKQPSTAPPKTPDLPRPEPARKVQVMPPAPYRITIQLPAADPSAPAEVVTEALRKAGVPFEVEMIERVNANAGSSPAQAPAPAAAPRPAPAPKPR
ncbi:MAG: hypothetical protein ACO24U_02620 [Prochlorococcaceae cyanobacterium]|jgi:hypothetical protein